MRSYVLSSRSLRTVVALGLLTALWGPVGLKAARAAERDFVGVLALAVEDDVANQIGLTASQKSQLLQLVDARENEALELALQLKDLPRSEHEAKLTPFRQQSEAKGLALLTAEQRAKLEEIRAARWGKTDPGDNGPGSAPSQAALPPKPPAGPEGARSTQAPEKPPLSSTSQPGPSVPREMAPSQGPSPGSAPGFRPEGDRSGPPRGFGDRSAGPDRSRSSFGPDSYSRRDRNRHDEGQGRPEQSAERPAEKLAERPSAPPQGLKFNFRFQPWQDVIQWFADQAGLSLVFETMPKGTCNYTDERDYTPTQAIDLLNSMLLIKGYTLVRKDRMLIVINVEDGIPPNLVSKVSETDLDQRGEYELVSVLFQLNKFAPEEAEKEIQKLIGPQGSIVVLAKSRQILVTETAGRLKTIREVIRRVEDPQGLASGQLQSFELKNIMPEEALTALRPLLDIPVDGSASSDGMVRLAVDPLGRKILATGNPETLARVDQILKMVDLPPAATGPAGANLPPQLQVYTVTAADPQSVLSVLQTMLSGLPDVRLAIDPKTNNLIALARPAEHATIKATLEELQHESGRIEVLYLRTLDPTAAVVTVKKLVGDSATDPRAPTVDADPTTRKLIIRGTEEQIAQIKSILQQLGETSLGTPEEMARSTVRTYPLAGHAAESALEQLQQIWPTLRKNKIRVVSPSAIIGSMRPSSDTAAPQPDATLLDQSIFEELLQQKKIIEVPVSPKEPAVEPQAPKSQPPAPQPLKGKSTGIVPADREGNRFQFVSQPVSPGSPAEEKAAPPDPTPGAAASATLPQPSPSDAGPAPAPEAPPESPVLQEPQGEPSTALGEPAPIVVAIGPSGIMIASQDVEALNQFEELLNSLTGGQTSTEAEMTIFYLKHAKAAVVADTLNQILGGSTMSTSSRGPGGSFLGDLAGAAIGGAGGRMVSSLLGMGGGASSFTPTGSVRIVPDTRLNALLVEANPADTENVEQLLKILDQKESPEEILADAKPRLIPVYNTSAQEIADIVKQVYQDKMVQSGGGSGGDRGGRPSPEQFIEMMRNMRGGGGSSRGSAGDQQKMSIGVDERTNSLVVSAPEQLYQEVKELVAQLDEAATDTNQSLEVVTLKSVSPQIVQQALASLTGADVNLATSSPSGSRGPSSYGSSSYGSPYGRPPMFGSSGPGSPGGSGSSDMQRRMEFFRQMMQGRGGPSRSSSDSGRSRSYGSSGYRPSSSGSSSFNRSSSGSSGRGPGSSYSGRGSSSRGGMSPSRSRGGSSPSSSRGSGSSGRSSGSRGSSSRGR